MLKNNEDMLIVQSALVSVLQDYENDDSVNDHELEVAKTVLSSLGDVLIDADNLDWHKKQVRIRERGGETSWNDTYPDETVSIRLNNVEVGRVPSTTYVSKDKDDKGSNFPVSGDFIVDSSKENTTKELYRKNPPYTDHRGVVIKPGDTVVMYVERGLDSWNFVVKVDENYVFKNDNISFDISQVDPGRTIVDNDLSYDSKKTYLPQYSKEEIDNYYNK